MFVHKVLYSRLLSQNFIKWNEKLVVSCSLVIPVVWKGGTSRGQSCH